MFLFYEQIVKNCKRKNIIEPTEGKILFDKVDLTILSRRELKHFRKKCRLFFMIPIPDPDRKRETAILQGENSRLY